MELVHKIRTSPKLFSSVDVTAFASILVVLAVVLLMVANMSHNPHRTISADLPKVLHPSAMQGASRENAMMITITREGRAFLGYDQLDVADLPTKIQDRLRDRGVERKVYLVADTRVRWDGVEAVLDGVRSAGIVKVAFLADQGQLPQLSH